ncbi:MAG: hypothetical protein KJ571_06440 [Bacteroidetes bacterium]|nr:hypothetical protein [Bacteroidota bacterium]
MRLHKENTVEIEPFYRSLKDVETQEVIESKNSNLSNYQNNGIMLEKYSHMFQNISTFEKETDNAREASTVTDKLNKSLKRIIPMKDSVILFFDESYHSLNPVNGESNSDLVKVMNHLYKEGIFNLLFESASPMIVPELNSYNNEGPKLNYLLFPFFEDGKRLGLLSILTTITSANFSSMDKQTIQMLLNLSLAKINKIILKSKLTSTYEDLQTYQAKLSNDFRLAAIGELTQGIIEDLLSPMQVIMSNVEFLNSTPDQEEEVKLIKSQIKKINSSVKRLIKFASVNQQNNKIHPIKINEIVTEYYSLVKSTLDNVNLECVLDFENNIPSILSHPNYIFQLLTNVIGLIKNRSTAKGGIIIQTRFNNDYILLKVVTTASLKTNSSKDNFINNPTELNIRIIENLIKKHEGEFNISSYQNTGSAVTLKFPLRRKIRK